MQYFCTKDELHGTDCHEFFKGEWDQRFWNDESIYIYDDVFRDTGLRHTLSLSLPDYSPYDPTEIYPEDWDAIKKKAGPDATGALAEADEWVREAFKEYGMFTILGI